MSDKSDGEEVVIISNSENISNIFRNNPGTQKKNQSIYEHVSQFRKLQNVTGDLSRLEEEEKVEKVPRGKDSNSTKNQIQKEEGPGIIVLKTVGGFGNRVKLSSKKKTTKTTKTTEIELKDFRFRKTDNQFTSHQLEGYAVIVYNDPLGDKQVIQEFSLPIDTNSFKKWCVKTYGLHDVWFYELKDSTKCTEKWIDDSISVGIDKLRNEGSYMLCGFSFDEDDDCFDPKNIEKKEENNVPNNNSCERNNIANDQNVAKRVNVKVTPKNDSEQNFVVESVKSKAILNPTTINLEILLKPAEPKQVKKMDKMVHVRVLTGIAAIGIEVFFLRLCAIVLGFGESISDLLAIIGLLQIEFLTVWGVVPTLTYVCSVVLGDYWGWGISFLRCLPFSVSMVVLINNFGFIMCLFVFQFVSVEVTNLQYFAIIFFSCTPFEPVCSFILDNHYWDFIWIQRYRAMFNHECVEEKMEK